MVLLAIAIALAIIVSIGLYYDFNDHKPTYYFAPCIIVAGMLYCLISFLISAADFSTKVVSNKEMTTPIYSITGISGNTSGSFALGTGSLHSGITYYYYYKEDGGLLVGEADASDTMLILDDKHVPYLDVKYQICKKEKGFHTWYYNFLEFSHKCNIKKSLHIPSDSVKMHYDVDSNFK